MNKPNKKTVAEAVSKYIKDCHPGGATLEVVEEGIRKEHYWWYVPVLPSVEPPKLFEYYEALALASLSRFSFSMLTFYLLN
ncbi:TPA: hypothetical protein EYP66_11225 [Candidatus Poribacteria bacterium]|nr:hypothetical protein [Candidatus Poribacteria bacterium]